MTVLDLIKGALRDIRVISDGAAPTASESADSIMALKLMLGDWENQDLLMYNVNNTLFSLAPGVTSYTIGEGYIIGSVVGTFLEGSYVKGATSGAVGYLSEKNGSTYKIRTSNTFVTGETINAYSFSAGTINSAIHAALVIVPAWQASRPLALDAAFVRVGTDDTAVGIVSNSDYNKIPDKTLSTDTPSHITMLSGYPNATIYVYPVPAVASSIMLTFKRHFSDINNVSDQIDLPAGYARAIRKNLAIELASEFGKIPDDTVVVAARESIAWIKRSNNVSLTCEFDATLSAESINPCILVG